MADAEAPSTTETLMIRDFPRDLAEQVRAYCLAEHIPIGMFIEVAVRKKVADDIYGGVPEVGVEDGG